MVLIAVPMIATDLKVTYTRVFGVSDGDTIIYVLDISGSMSELGQAFMADLNLDGDSGRGGGIVGDVSVPRTPGGAPGTDPPSAETLREVRRAAKITFAGLNALHR